MSNTGSIPGTLVFTDHVPAGLTISSAAAGNGSCTVSAQTVTCTLTGVPPGRTAPVNVIVTPTAPGAYTNNVRVAAVGVLDQNAANNSASAILRVAAAPPSPRCVVPKVKGIPSTTAKSVLTLLGCKVKLAHAHSRRVKAGLAIGTKPGAGSYVAGKLVTLVVSSGPPKRKHHSRRR